MYKEIQLKISENAINDMKNSLMVNKIVDRSPSTPEQAIFLILQAIEEEKSEISIELKADLKKKKTKKKSKKRKRMKK